MGWTCEGVGWFLVVAETPKRGESDQRWWLHVDLIGSDSFGVEWRSGSSVLNGGVEEITPARSGGLTVNLEPCS